MSDTNTNAESGTFYIDEGNDLLIGPNKLTMNTPGSNNSTIHQDQNNTIDLTKTATGGNLTKGINVLSFDCGRANLAYCLLEATGESGTRKMRIRAWNKIDLCATNSMDACSNLVKILSSYPGMNSVDKVVIEKQHHNNTSMMILSYAIYTHFMTLKNYGYTKTHFTVSMIPASNKFMSIPPEIHSCTQKNDKSRAVCIAKALVEKMHGDDSGQLVYFIGQNKKDDLADCLLQGHFILNRDINGLKQGKASKEMVKRVINVE